MSTRSALSRLFDAALSAAALVVCAPLLLAIGVAVALDSGFPILFSQQRVGRYGRPFTLWKFRSMRTGGRGPALTASGDARITRVGRFLRRHKLDELPQLWNVLRGDMSSVGPRPELPRYVACYPARFARILQARPGLTDPASLAYLDEERLLAGAADPERFYIDHILPRKLDLAEARVGQDSAWRDLAILARTVSAVWLPAGGRLWRGR